MLRDEWAWIRRVEHQSGKRAPLQECIDCLLQEEIRGAAPLGARGEHRPDTLTPGATSLAARPLGDFAVDHDEAEPLFHGVVRGLDAWRVQKAEDDKDLANRERLRGSGFPIP